MPKKDKPPINDNIQAFATLIKNLPSRAEFVETFGNVVKRVKQFETSLTRDFSDLLTTVNKKVDDKIASIHDGIDGRDGVDGKDGLQGPKGERGEVGPPGESIVGPAGKDGKDGSPDDAFDTRNKLELLEGDERLKATAISGLDEEIKKVAEAIPAKGGTTGWGAHPLTIQQSGTTKAKTARFLNFKGTGVTSVVQTANGVTDVTISGGASSGGHTIQDEGVSLTQRTKLNFIGAGVTATDDAANDATKITVSATGSFGKETPTGTVDDSNVTFTVANDPKYIVVNGATMFANAGYSYSAPTVTLDNPIGTGGNIFSVYDASGAGGGSGTVTSVTSADANATVANSTTTPVITIVSAPKLQTARNIDGQAFDGTAAITVIAPGTHAATSKATPVDADELPLVDSAASNVLKKLTWANLKATMKAYTDTLYPSGSGTSTGTNTGDQTNISGNAATVTTNANLTGDVTSVGNATTLTNAPVIAKVLTGYTSGAGTVAATDSILQAIQKLNGNDATNANLTGPITSTGNATAIASQTGTGTTFVMSASPTITGTLTSNATLTSKLAYGTQVDNGNSSTAITIDWTTSNFQKVTRTGNCTYTFTAPTGPATLVLNMVHEASGTAYTNTFSPVPKWAGGTVPTPTNTTGAIDVITFYYDGTSYYGSALAAFA